MNVVYNMDCMEYMRTLQDKAFDLAVVDPPYRDENKAPTKWMRDSMSCKGLFLDGIPTDAYFAELERVSKSQIIFGANNFGRPFKGFISWDKGVRGANRYSQCEIASLSDNLSTVSTIAEVPIYGNYKDKIHPTQKPVALYTWILQKYAKPGDKILDTHLGSGSSRIAAYDLGFDFVGCEIDPHYFQAQEKRFAEHTAQISLFTCEEGKR